MVFSFLLFPSPPCTYDEYSDNIVWIPAGCRDPRECSAADVLPCLWLPFPNARYVMVYLHANAEDLGSCRKFCTLLHDCFGVNVLAVEYPGYGLAYGQATEESVEAATRGVYDYVTHTLHWAPEDIIVVGRSIGSGPAVSIACEAARRGSHLAGLVLIAAFTSIRDVVRGIAPWAARFMPDYFPNKDKMHQVSCGVVCVHGTEDRIIPLAHSVELFNLCGNPDKMFLPIHGGDHNGTVFKDNHEFVLPMINYLSAHGRRSFRTSMQEKRLHRYNYCHPDNWPSLTPAAFDLAPNPPILPPPQPQYVPLMPPPGLVNDPFRTRRGVAHFPPYPYNHTRVVNRHVNPSHSSTLRPPPLMGAAAGTFMSPSLVCRDPPLILPNKGGQNNTVERRVFVQNSTASNTRASTADFPPGNIMASPRSGGGGPPTARGSEAGSATLRQRQGSVAPSAFGNTRLSARGDVPSLSLADGSYGTPMRHRHRGGVEGVMSMKHLNPSMGGTLQLGQTRKGRASG
ncbi:unnamed protein product [Vitrella brassicaformis CCMP3155]|uniref:Serine aminopeptidase S33 domain-containing protein n=1 Tax=Vitrella brassicaformis (strain CCMP3155) TaxID=1169540 RepID=A0A0G4GSI9_VITBC|nr:unnamed protein product [Vitrella brassicaformis CCMP3155]|eukprot:CEM33441.1 unnamed protein product [Vitrella brassicaformis CCMP3155]